MVTFVMDVYMYSHAQNSCNLKESVQSLHCKVEVQTRRSITWMEVEDRMDSMADFGNYTQDIPNKDEFLDPLVNLFGYYLIEEYH